MTNYWLVGANWEGQDQFDKFMRRGQWILGWDEKDQPELAKLRNQMIPGDRIAIKKMLGKGASDIAILALGIVKETDEEDKRIYVNWIITDLNRRLPARGCFKAIHGPFSQEDAWVKEVFHL